MNFCKKSCIVLILALAVCVLLTSCSGIKKIDSDVETTTDQDNDYVSSKSDKADTLPSESDVKNQKVVCIDPGHGFGDVGCESDYFNCYEKDITISVANKLKSCLEDEGIAVILTHNGVQFPSAAEIVLMADKYNIDFKSEEVVENDIFGAYERSVYENILDAQYGLDLFISLHVNSIENANYLQGFSIDYYEGNPHVAFLGDFCNKAKSELSDKFSSDVVIFADSYEEAYKVTKYCSAPSVLFEMGYASNREDAANLQSDEWQQKLADALCNLIVSAIEEE